MAKEFLKKSKKEKKKRVKKLSPKEVDAILEEIRRRYDELIVHYMKTPRLKDFFNDRYYLAVKTRADLSDFLDAELTAVKELDKREAEARLQADMVQEKRLVDRENKKTEEKSFADRIIEEFADKIKQYPEVMIHPDASLEIRHLVGALGELEKGLWPHLDGMLRKYDSRHYSIARQTLESALLTICVPHTSGFPPALQNYYGLMNRFPRDYRQIESEEKRFLVQTAHLLGSMQLEVVRLIDFPGLDPGDREILAGLHDELGTVMDDFRLNDLARLGQG